MAGSPHIQGTISRAWYSASLADFLEAGPDMILGQLARNSEFPVLPTQIDAWLHQIQLMKAEFRGFSGSLLMEFSIPRMGRRVDAVLLIGPAVVLLEFKVGAAVFDRAALDQVWDYALDLKNFHEASHAAPVIPILIATAATVSPATALRGDEDSVYRPIAAHPAALRDAIALIVRTVGGQAIDAGRWLAAPYRPTPTIIEAARSLYAQHSVDAIARFDAGAQNLRVTSSRIEELVTEAKQQKRKVICFLTGVPGAGKTLVGLNLATQHRDAQEQTHAVFLSGNGPLVAVLREALTRDEVTRQQARGVRVRKAKVGESVKAFIQNVHHFRDELLKDTGAPDEHVAIFDEAQRAWDLRQTANFMKRRKRVSGFSHSEPEFLISGMNRHSDWAVIVCLVGGGQEINTGEAGIGAWIDAVNSGFPDWYMHISSRLTDSEYAAGNAQKAVRESPRASFDDCLHLSVSMRSFRAENVSFFVKALLDRDRQNAQAAFGQLIPRYPIALTRDLHRAKQWIRDHARGSERYGLLASSKAHRLKPDAVDIRVEVDPVHWFLDDKNDTRSSYYLEDAATEFQVQGLEVDWACVAWDGDLRFTGEGWQFRHFRGDSWRNVKKAANQQYLRNAYRVLLTRARQGMVIYVPAGNTGDPTRSASFYDPTYRYLAELGIPELP
jgi:hypothetical protein